MVVSYTTTESRENYRAKDLSSSVYWITSKVTLIFNGNKMQANNIASYSENNETCGR